MALAITIVVLLCFTAFGIGCLMAQARKYDGSSPDCKITEKLNLGICIIGTGASVIGMFSFVIGFMPLATVSLLLAAPMFMLGSYKCGYAFMITIIR